MELSDNFLRLGPTLERVGPQRESISRTSGKFDELLKNKFVRDEKLRILPRSLASEGICAGRARDCRESSVQSIFLMRDGEGV